jgi:GYF domain 2
MSELWYYAEGNETRGPIGFDQLIELLPQLPTPKAVLVWREGFDDWRAAENIREIAEKLIRPPPLSRSLPSSRSPISTPSPEYPAMNASPEKPRRNWLHSIATLVAWVLAYGLARAIGGNFWMPVVFIGVSYWIFEKLKVQAAIALMLAVLLGHTLWIAAGHAFLVSINKPSPDLAWFSIDLIALAVALIWCLKKQSVASCAFVLLYELVGLALNIMGLDEMTKVSNAAAWMHVSLRAIGCGLAIYAIVKVRQRRQKTDRIVATIGSLDA